jgi:aryl-alcohol dehydrogenase-like predicted oxidoreductase
VSDQADFANEDVNMSPQPTLAELPVGHLGFGAMRITGPGIWGPPQDESKAIALLRRVVGKGVTFIDTADSYGPGISETLIAKALYPYPAGLVVATKGGLTRPSANRWVTDCRPEHLRLACADSLRRLRLERIELYQLHAVDHRIPIITSSIWVMIAFSPSSRSQRVKNQPVTATPLAPCSIVPSSSRPSAFAQWRHG